MAITTTMTDAEIVAALQADNCCQNFGRSSDWAALRVLANPDASVRMIVRAVNGLDIDGGLDVSAYSHASAATDAARRMQAERPGETADRAVRFARRDELAALEAMTAASPRDEIRRRLLARLRAAGVQVSGQLHCCRVIADAFRTISQAQSARDRKLPGAPYLAQQAEAARATLARYGAAS